MFIFDLDLTVWECFNSSKHPIWAKQLIPPFSIKNYCIEDDVGSSCYLKEGFFDFINYLYNKKHKIGYCSIGAYSGLKEFDQPSIKLLKTFKIYHMFNGPKILEYKTFNKYDYLKTISEKTYFFDDNDHIIKSISSLENIIVYDAKLISDWRNQIEKF